MNNGMSNVKSDMIKILENQFSTQQRIV